MVPCAQIHTDPGSSRSVFEGGLLRYRESRRAEKAHTPGDPRNIPNGHSIYCPLVSLHSDDPRTDERLNESDALSLEIRIIPKMGSGARD